MIRSPGSILEDRGDTPVIHTLVYRLGYCLCNFIDRLIDSGILRSNVDCSSSSQLHGLKAVLTSSSLPLPSLVDYLSHILALKRPNSFSQTKPTRNLYAML